jgi:hypothetical protein
MFLKLFKGYHCKEIQFAKKIHTQMCLAALFDQRRKIQNEWNDDDDEQKKIFYEEEKNNSLEKLNQNIKCDIAKCSGLVNCNYKNKSETYMIQYEGGVGKISR